MPSDKDLAIGAVGGTPGGVAPSGAVYAGGMPAGSAISKKPCYLVVIDGDTKNSVKHFVAMEKPEFLPNFIQVKGFWTGEEEDSIVVNFSEMVANTDKANIVDMMFPASKIHYIRSLVFNAAKPKSVFGR